MFISLLININVVLFHKGLWLMLKVARPFYTAKAAQSRLSQMYNAIIRKSYRLESIEVKGILCIENSEMQHII